MEPRDAALEARRRFGNVGATKERFHQGRTIAWMESTARQLRGATRRLVRSPVFSIAAVVTITLGIGATTAVFSLVDSVLLRPLPFAAPDRLVDLSHTVALQGLSVIHQSDATFLYYRAANHVFTDIGAYEITAVNLSATGSGDAAHAQRVDAARTSAGVFGVLGVHPLLGRSFAEREDLPSSAPAVIIGEDLWRAHFGADPRIIGRAIVVDGITRTVIGVMPRGFSFPEDRTEIWLPIGIDPANTHSAAFEFYAVARLRPGVTPERASADLARLLPKVPEAYPGRLTAPSIAAIRMRPAVRTLTSVMVGNVGRTLWVIFGAAACLLLVGCANVANLVLVRAEGRQHELSVRRALGASRRAIAGEFVSEALILALIGGVLGVGLAELALRALTAGGASLSIPRLAEVRLDTVVLIAAAVATLATALVVSVVPAVRFGRSGLAAALGQTGRSLTAGRERHRTRQAFVVVQVALALVLVAAAGLMARTFAALRSVGPGFDPRSAYTYSVELPAAEYPTSASAAALTLRATSELASLPRVRSAGVLSKVPLDGESREDSAVWVQDRLPRPGTIPNVHQIAFASAKAFAALGARVIQGREFTQLDASNPPQEAIVTRALARLYWGDSVALGRHLGFSPTGPWYTVVGVVGDLRGDGLEQPPDQTVYLPLVVHLFASGAGMGNAAAAGAAPLWTPRTVSFVVRGGGTTADLTAQVQRTLSTLAPSAPLYNVRSLDEVVARSTSRVSFTLALLEIASLAAVLIGAVGLYGVVSYVVSLRRRELAVRVALGAQPSALRRRVLAQSLGLAALGVALGLVAAVLLMRVMASLLYGVSPTDPATLAASVGAMLAVAVAASWIPARRASAVAPAIALRADA